MAVKQGKGNIEIERNVIERYLMTFKNFIKENSRKSLYIAVGLVVVIAISVSAFVYIDASSAKDLENYESVIDSYRMNPADRVVKDKTISSLREIIKNTRFGYVNEMSHYMLGNLLYDDEKFAEAYDMFSVFVKKSSSDDLFIPVAVNKMAVCLEEQGKIDEALSLLLKYEEESKNAVVGDQLIYNTGRLYSVKGDRIKAKEYFSQVISTYPDSVFSERAKERLFLLGTIK